jgi:hypothetical protein
MSSSAFRSGHGKEQEEEESQGLAGGHGLQDGATICLRDVAAGLWTWLGSEGAQLWVWWEQ